MSLAVKVDRNRSSSEIVREEVLEMKERDEENRRCADCRSTDTVEWVSVSFGVFLCISCAGVHRRPGVQIPIVRSIRLDTWTEKLLEMMRGKGNGKARVMWEANVPPCWVKPWPSSDCPFALREQWIEAKYTRREFTKDADDAAKPYLRGQKQGYLKKKKLQTDSDVFNYRWFVVKDGALSYYKDRNGSPKATIPLVHVNVALHVPGMTTRNNVMLIVFYDMERKKTRNIFVAADTSFEIIDWFLVIRQAKINLMRKQFGDMADDVVRKRASQEIIHYGWMSKTSPTGTTMRKRFFILDGKCLRYYNSPKAAFPLGELVLGSPSEGYWVDDNLPESIDNNPCTFMLHVPDRARGGYPLQALDTASRKQWMSVLLEVIQDIRETPNVMACLPQSYDYDTDTLKRHSIVSDGAESSASSSTNRRASWSSSVSGSSGSVCYNGVHTQDTSSFQERERLT